MTTTRRRQRLALALLPLWLGGPGAALAQGVEDFRVRDAGSLAQLCSTPESSPLFGEARQFCYGFIAGAGSMYRETVAAGGMRRLMCPKTEPSLEEIRAAFVDWMDRNTGARSEAAVDGLFRAGAAAYPCG